MTDTITRWECPYCKGDALVETTLCSGSFLDKGHPSNVAAVERTYVAVDVVEAICRHQDMPDGESWEQAYNEVCDMARAAINAATGEQL